MEIQDIIQGLTSAEIAAITTPEARTLIVNTTLQQAVIYVNGTFKQASFENTDDIPEGTKKFATTSDLDQINTNASDITSLQTGKEDAFTKNSAFNKDFGTSAGDVLQGDTRTITPTEITTIGNQSNTNTGDETDASIKSKYENNPDTNAYTDAEKTKLSGLESSKFVGEFVSLSALQTAFPTAPIGSYAYVDTGVGQPVEKYIWDNNDSQWELQQGQSTAETPATIKTKYESNPDTNAFTDAEKTNLSNQSGTNTNDETTSTIQSKRPLKTIEGNTLEGSGNIDLNKSDVGLGNVDNTSDADKPISNDTQNALDGKKNDFTENTAFNKDFGTNANTVLEGDTRTITASEITTIGNQSGTNTGDETTSTIQTKRPIKTVNGQTLEGSGNVVISSVPAINSASFISSLSQNVGTLLNGTGTNIQITLTNILGPNTFGYNIASGNVTIPTAGWYKISYKCLTESFSNNRQNTSFVIKRNLIDVIGTFTAGYLHNFSNDEASAALSPFIPQFQFSAGDTIGLYAISGGDTNQTALTTSQECVLTIEFLG